EWTINIPSADRMRITASGDAELRDLVAGQFEAERITVQSKLNNGELSLDPIELEHQSGRADVHVTVPVQQPTRVRVVAHVKDWPATAPSGEASANVSAQSELAVDLANQSAIGPLHAQIAFIVKDQNAGSLSVDSTIDGRIVNVQRFQATALGGS